MTSTTLINSKIEKLHPPGKQNQKSHFVSFHIHPSRLLPHRRKNYFLESQKNYFVHFADLNGISLSNKVLYSTEFITLQSSKHQIFALLCGYKVQQRNFLRLSESKYNFTHFVMDRGQEVRELKLGASFTSNNGRAMYHTLKCKYATWKFQDFRWSFLPHFNFLTCPTSCFS